MTTTNEFKKGQTVRFAEVLEAGDEELRYEVLEVNGDRMMVRLICDLVIAPIQNLPTNMFVLA